MNSRGFTLMEVVLYVGLFGILMSGAVVAAYQLLNGGDRNQIAVAVQEEGTFLNRKINWALTNATEVDAEPPNTLTVTRPDLGARSPLVIIGDSGTVRLSRGGGAATVLNAETMTVSDMVFTVEPAAQGGPASVTARFKVRGTPFVYKKFLRQ